MKRWVGISLLLLVPLGGAAAWWWYTIPHVYRHVSAPDGSWQVKVLRQRVPPYIEGVNVIVRAEDAHGAVLHEEVIDNRDVWSGVDERYPVVEMDNERVRIGPRWWNGHEATYFILVKSDLAGAA